eukprot:CAMPEP_0183402404 /NCGR_PEP_ID=MMETSP0370-20130417/13886_1 /TAXON_ID=268820 /ORGANISM="Peridinium aciculiferum, Strain PAER-2" /LENGTH=117 /DNA_ID=CAMNT_0025583989 /DNA_START=5 /DNA_END=358 /DNA_ORIENTATION=-
MKLQHRTARRRLPPPFGGCSSSSRLACHVSKQPSKVRLSIPGLSRRNLGRIEARSASVQRQLAEEGRVDVVPVVVEQLGNASRRSAVRCYSPRASPSQLFHDRARQLHRNNDAPPAD